MELTEEHKTLLKNLYMETNDPNRKPLHQWYNREVGGYFTVEDGKIKDCVVLGIGCGNGTESAFVHPCCRDYVFHTHPRDEKFHDTPPSGADLIGTLAWGGPGNQSKNEDGSLHTVEELVVTQAGFWRYKKTPELKKFYDSLLVKTVIPSSSFLTETKEEEENEEMEKEKEEEDVDYNRDDQENFFEVLEWYCVYAIGLYCSNLVDLQKFVEFLRTINVGYMVSFAQKNPAFQKYIEDQMEENHEETMVLDEVQAVLAQRPDFAQPMPGFELSFSPF